MKHDGICPQCRKNPVPNGCHFCSRACAKRHNYLARKHGGNSHPVWTGRTLLENKRTRYYHAAQAGD